MKTLVNLLVLFIFLVGFTVKGQERPRIIVDVPTNQKPFTGANVNTDNFQFAIVTDRTGGHRPGVFVEGVRKLNLLQPEFVMSVGDLIEGYTKDEEVLDAEWKEFNGFIDSLQMPFFYVPGNHDITNEVMNEKWKELFGVTYYHFVYNDILFLCLNSEDNWRGAGKGTIDDAQYEYIKKTLSENTDVKWTLVFLHQPLWVQEDTKRWEDVEALLAGRPHNVFAGHYHRYWKSERNNGKYIALATTGGGSRLRGTAYGEFDHVVWVTMTPQGPILANLLLEGIWDENVVTEPLVDLVQNRPFPISLKPIFLHEGNTEKLTAEIKVVNDSDYPMLVQLLGRNNEDFTYTLSKTEFEIAPNSVDTVELIINNSNAANLIESDPVLLNAEVSYTYPGRPDIVLKQEVQIAPVLRNSIKPVKQRIKLDGDLSEWSGNWYSFSGENSKNTPFDYRGEADFNGRFLTAFDEDYLYIAVAVTDDEIYTNEQGSHWNQDAVLLGLDGHSWPISAMNKGEGMNKNWLGYLNTFRQRDPVYNPQDLPVNVRSEIRKTATGMTVEIAIPISYLNDLQDGNWSEFRLNVGYYDVDQNGESRTEHYWMPAWENPESLAGQGMFFRQ